MSLSSPLAAVAAAFGIFTLAFPIAAAWPFWLFCATTSVLLTVPLARIRARRLSLWMVVCGIWVALAYQVPTSVQVLVELFPEVAGARITLVVYVMVALGAAAVLPLPGRWRSIPIASLVLLVGLFVVISITDLRRGPPDIDVYEMHLESLARFWRGQSPYGGSFRNIYPHTDWYGPGLVVDGRVQIGFAYPPLPFFFALLGDWLGDFRLGYLIATVGAAGLFAAIGGPAGRAGAVVYLLASRHPWILHQSWIEPVFILGFAGVLCASVRRPRALPLALGLFWATKQYAVLVMPLVPFLLPMSSSREVVRALLRSFVVAAAIYVPFFLWDMDGFFRSVVLCQLIQPFRYDSMGFLSMWVGRGHPPPGSSVTLGALLVGLAVAIGLAPRRAAGFAAGSALALFLFFAFSKQPFMNYYHGCIGILAGVVATSLGGRRS